MARSGAALLLLLFCCVASGVYEDSPDSRKLFGGYRIVPKPCRPDAGGDDLGICMFNYECSARDGVVAGACMDGFLFGACCRLPPGHTFELPDADLLTEDASTFPPENPNAISATSRRPDQVSDLLNDPQLHVSAHPDADTVLLTGPATSRPELSTFSYVESNGVEEHTSTPKYHTAAITPTYYSTVSKWSRPTAEYDEGLVLVPTITKRPEPGPNPESINHIISLLNDSSPGLVDPGPEPEPGLSTWVAVNADPTSYPSTSSHHVAGPSYEVVTTEQGTTRPVPTVIVLGPLSSDATTSRPSLITSSKLSSTVPTLVTKRPSSTGFFITKRPSSTTATNRPSTHFSRPTEATNRPSTYFSRPTETIYRPSTHFSRPTEATNRPSTHFVRPTEATYRPFTHFTRPTETTSRPSTHFSRPTEATNWHSTHFSRPTETTNRPSTHFSRPTEATNRPSTHFSRPTEATNRPSTQFNRPTEATNRPSTHFNRPTESTNRPPTLYTKRPTEVTYFTNRPLTGITHVTNRPGTGTIFVTERPSFTNRPTSGTTLVSNQPWVTTPIDYPDTTSGVDSLANFPPVRNPSFNMTQHERPPVVLPPNPEDLFNVDDIPTPTFIEDDKLNSNLQSFVDKIVQSLDGNFHDLEEVLYAGKNTTSTTTTITTTTRRPVTSKRPTSTTSPKPTRRPTPTGSTPVRRTTTSPTSALLTSRPTRPPQTSLRPRPSTPRPSRPSTQATKPSQRPSTQTTRPSQRPSTQTTRPSQRPSTQSTRPSQRPTAQSTRPSQKPITQSTRPSQRPTTQTTRPSQRPKPSRPSTTLRPTSPVKATTTKRSTTTSSTTQLLIQQDETIKTTTTEEPTTLTTTAEELALPTKPVDYKHECGVRPLMQKKGRIVGGKSSTFGEWPWQVLVRESTWLGLFTKNKCGGVLITSRYVITAAHCQPGFLANLVAVLGEFDISGELESRRSVTKNVRRVVVHRQYDAATFANDLALLELESPVAFDEHIVPICMPRDKEDFTGRMATVTGWGRLKYGGGVPNLLQEVQVPVIENSVCQEMFHTAGHSKVILNSFMCAGYANGQKDSCEGDSGGPLMLEREDGRWVLVGTVSHGIKCAAPYLPGVYMRTTYYKPWLHAITGVN